MDKLRLLVRALRIHWTAGTTIAVVLGLTLAWQDGHFSPAFALVAFAMMVLAHCSVCVWDDTVDYRLYRAQMYEEQDVQTRFSGGSGVLTNGLVSVGEMVALFAALFTAFALLLLYAVYTVGIVFLLLFVLVMVFSLGYGAPPFKWSYRGLGEIGLMLLEGPLITLMYYYAATRYASPQAAVSIPAEYWAISFVPGFLAFAQTFWAQYMDLEEDTAAGKRNLSVRFGLRAGLSLQVGGIALAIVTIAALAVRNPWLLPTLGVLAFGAREAVWILRHRDDRDAVTRRFKRHPLFRVHVLSTVAIVLGLISHALTTRPDVSAFGAAFLAALSVGSCAMACRIFLPGLIGRSAEPATA